MRLHILIVVVAAFALLGGPPGFISKAKAGSSPTHNIQSIIPATAKKPAPAIFVTNPTLNSLSVFPIGSNGNVPSLFTQTFLSQPHGIAYWKGKLYVANSAPDSITAYPANGERRPNPIITISGEKTQLDIPVGIALDSAGKLYVVNQSALDSDPASVTIYNTGSNGDVAPIARITGPNTGLEHPTGLAVDSDGHIYVVNDSDSPKKPDSITVYDPGSNGDAAPVRTISGPATLLSDPQGIALDSSGNLFVTSRQHQDKYCCSAGVLIYSPGANGNTAPTASIDGDFARLTMPGGIAIGANGNIYVTNPGAPGPEGVVVYTQQDRGTEAGLKGDQLSLKPILTYRAHAAPTMIPAGPQGLTPLTHIEGDKTRIDGPWGIAVDTAGNMYVTNSESDSINLFGAGAAGNVTPSVTIESPTGVSHSNAIALDASGKIYVANGGGEIQGREAPANTVSIYPAGSYANVGPIATLGGAMTASTGYADKNGIDQPQAIALDAQGRIFIANRGGGYDLDGNITVYPAGSDGDVRPIAAIGGNSASDHTGLDNPVSLALDSAGNLYVLNAFGGHDTSGSITIYPSDANGNIAPKATIVNGIHDQHTQFQSPAGMALDSAGNIYVTNDGSTNAGSDTITIYAAGRFGDVAPMATISGSNTGLHLPHGIAIDSHGNIYVSNDSHGSIDVFNDGSNNEGVDTITVYAPGSRGDVRPIATISGSLTGLGQPAGLAVGP